MIGLVIGPTLSGKKRHFTNAYCIWKEAFRIKSAARSASSSLRSSLSASLLPAAVWAHTTGACSPSSGPYQSLAQQASALLTSFWWWNRSVQSTDRFADFFTFQRRLGLERSCLLLSSRFWRTGNMRNSSWLLRQYSLVLPQGRAAKVLGIFLRISLAQKF